METSLEYFQEYLAIFQAIFDVNLYIDTVLFVRRRESSIALLAVLGFQHWWSKMLACCILYRLVLFLNKILSFRDTLDTRCVQFPAFSFFHFFFFIFLFIFWHAFFPHKWLLFMHCQPQLLTKSFMNSASVHSLRTHKFYFSATFLIKMGPTVLFTYLKIILLQCFQFSVSAK